MQFDPLTRISCPVCLVAVVLSLLPAAPALAQSQSDLRAENQALRTVVEDLRRELTAVTAVIARLEAEIERLRSELAARPASSSPSNAAAASSVPALPVTTIDESKPDASPRALFRAIVEDYEKSTAGVAMGDDEDASERVVYLRLLRNWASRINRDLKCPIEWHVKISGDPMRVGRGYVMHMTAVDPSTGAELGDPFDVFVNRMLANRLKQMETRFGLEDVLVLKGTLTPQVRINENRMSEGPFDNPRFIGTFAEFGFGVNAQSLLPPREEKESKKKKKTGQRDASADHAVASDRDHDDDESSEHDSSSSRRSGSRSGSGGR